MDEEQRLNFVLNQLQWLVSRNILIFKRLKFQEIRKTLESQVILGDSYRK